MIDLDLAAALMQGDDGLPDLAAIIAPPPDWTRDALCLEYAGRVDFFATYTAPAKAICRRCAVSADCLAYANDAGHLYGVWGGLSGIERKAAARANAKGSGRNRPEPSTVHLPLHQVTAD